MYLKANTWMFWLKLVFRNPTFMICKNTIYSRLFSWLGTVWFCHDFCLKISNSCNVFAFFFAPILVTLLTYKIWLVLEVIGNSFDGVYFVISTLIWTWYLCFFVAIIIFLLFKDKRPKIRHCATEHFYTNIQDINFTPTSQVLY